MASSSEATQCKQLTDLASKQFVAKAVNIWNPNAPSSVVSRPSNSYFIRLNGVYPANASTTVDRQLKVVRSLNFGLVACQIGPIRSGIMHRTNGSEWETHFGRRNVNCSRPIVATSRKWKPFPLERPVRNLSRGTVELLLILPRDNGSRLELSVGFWIETLDLNPKRNCLSE